MSQGYNNQRILFARQNSLSPFSWVKSITHPLLQPQSELILCHVRRELFRASKICLAQKMMVMEMVIFPLQGMCKSCDIVLKEGYAKLQLHLLTKKFQNHKINHLWELFKLISQNNSINIMNKTLGIINNCDAEDVWWGLINGNGQSRPWIQWIIKLWLIIRSPGLSLSHL